MKREEVKAIFPDATDEQLKSIMDLNGADVEKAKGKVAETEKALKDKTESLNGLTAELEALKQANASGEDWKAKFEALQAENDAKEKQAEADRLAKEREDALNQRFTSVVGDKKFSHSAIEADYRKKFGEALANKENTGKSDADIFHELTKEDKNAFVGVEAVRLAGGANRGSGKKYSSKEEIMSIKDGAERRTEMLAHPQFFPELNK